MESGANEVSTVRYFSSHVSFMYDHTKVNREDVEYDKMLGGGFPIRQLLYSTIENAILIFKIRLFSILENFSHDKDTQSCYWVT